MKKKLIAIISIVLVLAIVIGIVCVCLVKKKDDNKSSDKEIPKAKNEVVEDIDGNYTCLTEGFTDILVVDEESVIKAVDSVADSIGISNASEELQVIDIRSVKDDSYYCIQQYYHNIPVYGRSLVVTANNAGKASSLTSNYKPVSEGFSLVPTVSYDEITDSIKEYLNFDETQSLNISEDNLVIYNFDDSEVLAYCLNIGSGEIIVDANSAEVIDYKQNLYDISGEVQSDDGTVTSIGWQNDDGSYHLYNDEYKISVFDVKGITTTFVENGKDVVHEDFTEYGIDTLYSEDNIFDKNAIIILNDIIDVSDFYKNIGFTGFERVHVAINDNTDEGKNAFGGGGELDGVDYAIMLFGDEFDSNCKDVVAHEFTHAVSGLIVDWNREDIENNALNEAYSDIFGTLYENPQNPDWKMVHLSKLLRDITDPEATNCYDNMSDINVSDKYDKYTLSTIISHSAYLMWSGIDGRTEKISGTKLSEMWFRSMLMLQSDADFSQCRNAVELSARIMYKNGDLTEEQLATVITAFEVVGIENATFTFSETVKNEFDLTVLNSLGTDDVQFSLEVIKLPKIVVGPRIDMPKLIMEKVSITGQQALNLEDGKYLLTITDINDERNVSQTIKVVIVVDGNNANAKDEVIINTDFTEVIVVVLNEEQGGNINEDTTDTPSSEESTTGDYIDICAGAFYTVGLKSDGTVIATGYNGFGQCDVSGWSDIIEVSAGYKHTVGLKSNGTVVATGDSSLGQCDVSAWTDIVAISADWNHTVGLKSDGTVVATGDGYYQGGGSQWWDVSDWTDIVAISTGDGYTIGLKSDGTVVATGNGSWGQCDVSGWSDIIEVSAGYKHTVGLKSDGTVIATGDNYMGQCDVSGWTDIVAISTGYNHTLGLKSDGTIVAVGNNDFGQCNVSDWTDIVAISGGHSHSVGTKSDGTIVVIGDNRYGQCDTRNLNN